MYTLGKHLGHVGFGALFAVWFVAVGPILCGATLCGATNLCRATNAPVFYPVASYPVVSYATDELAPQASGELQFSQSSFGVTEGSATVTLTVERINGADGTVSVDFATSPRDAEAGVDYEEATGTLSFADGETVKTFTITILNDAIVESHELLDVTLSNPSNGATIANGFAFVEIIDDDAPPQGALHFDQSSYGDLEGSGSIQIEVRRVNGTSGSVDVDYATNDNSATAGADYVATAGTLTFADGVTSQFITINLLQDTLSEGTEIFGLTLLNPTGGAALATPSSAAIAIGDDDEAGLFRFERAGYLIDENGGAATIRVERLNGSTGVVSVDYATADDGAAAGADYDSASGTLTFADGTTVKTFTVDIVDDAMPEPNETIILSLQNPTGGAAIDGDHDDATILIQDNDSFGQFQFRQKDYSIAESDSLIVLEVDRVGGTFGAASVAFSTQADTATSDSDYISATGILTFASGVGSQILKMGIIDDTALEPTERFTVSLSNPTGGPVLGTPLETSVAIIDNDASGTVRFERETYTETESSGVVSLTVQRIGGSDGDVTVDYSSADGSATAPADYSPISGVLAFAAGQTEQRIDVTIADDNITEQVEWFHIALTGPTGGVQVDRNSGTTIRIVDNDARAPGRLQFSKTAYSVSEGAGSIEVTVERIDGRDGEVQVAYASSDGTATQGDDYQSVSGVLTFGDGEIRKSLSITIQEDRLAEGSENINLLLSNPTGGATLGTRTGASVLIQDNERSSYLPYIAR